MKICMLGNGIGKVFIGKTPGGAQKQCALIAEEFARRGHSVTIFDWDFDSSIAPINIPGITITECWNANRGIPGIRIISRLKEFTKKIDEIEPDVFYCRGASLYASLILLYLKNTRVFFLWGLANEQDLVPSIKYKQLIKPDFYQFINFKILFTIASKVLIRYSDLIICQTLEQNKIVAKKRSNHIIASNIIKQSENLDNIIKEDKLIIWVGKFTGTKGEKELLSLAKKTHQYKILAVGPVSEGFDKTSTYQDLQNQENIELLGGLTNERLNEYYKISSIHIHTAPHEGFNNVFLEAWNHGLPVVSLYVNPNKLLVDDFLGNCCQGDIALMSKTISKYLENSVLSNEIGQRAYNYLGNNHSPKMVIDKIINSLNDIKE